MLGLHVCYSDPMNKYNDNADDEIPKGWRYRVATLRFFWFFWLPPTVVSGFLGWIFYDEGMLLTDPVTGLVLLGIVWLFVFCICFAIRFGWGG